MTDNLLEVTTRDGKYTVIQAPHGGMTFKRHGEDWEVANRDFSGVGLILARLKTSPMLIKLLKQVKLVISEGPDRLFNLKSST
jgi:hypothetical protein